MKILQINTVCGNGSVGRITVDLYQTLVEAGHQGRILYGRRTAPETADAIRIGSTLDMGTHVLATFFKGEHGFASRKYTEKIIKAIVDYEPDVIHLHNLHGFYLQVEQLFSYLREAGIPVVWTLHDCWPFTGHCAYFDYAGCDKWKTECGYCPQQKNAYPYALFRDNSRENYRRKRKAFLGVENLTLVTPSHWLADLVKESFLKDYEVQVIPNGIDLTRFSPISQEEKASVKELLGISGKYMILGVANVWERRKGLPCFKALAGDLPENYAIVLLGLSEKQLGKLPENIKGLTRTGSVEELAAYYSAADVYVNATLEDNFPTTNLEALACGTQVLTFATGGSVESVDDTCGAVVEKGNQEALREAVIRMCREPKSQRACMKRAALYDKKVRFGEYLALYERLAGISR